MDNLNSMSLDHLYKLMQEQKDQDTETAHSAGDDILCELVARLAAIRPEYPIISLILEEYKKQQNGWWYA